MTDFVSKIPKIFSKHRIVNEITDMLHIKPGMRNNSQLRKIARFLEEIKIFKEKENEPSAMRELCNNLILKDCLEGEQIFTQGDIGSTFYIIL